VNFWPTNNYTKKLRDGREVDRQKHW